MYLCRTNRKEATEGKLFQTFDLAVTLNLLKRREEKDKKRIKRKKGGREEIRKEK